MQKLDTDKVGVGDVILNPFVLAPETIPELIHQLTPRQLEIVALLVQGHGHKQIASLLSISLDAVQWHIGRAREKMGLDNRTQLIVIYVMWKMIQK